MRRKLIKQGLGGVTISLPISWVRKKRLQPGSEIDVSEVHGKLVIGASTPAEKRKNITLHVADEKLLRTILAAHYRQGYSQIILHAEQELAYKTVASVVDSLYGYEIVDHTSKTITVRDMSGEPREPVNSVVHRLFQQVIYLFTRISEGDSGSHTKKEVIRLRDYAQRTIMLADGDLSYELYALVLFLEKIAGVYSTLDSAKVKELQPLNTLLRQLHEAYVQRDAKKAASLYAAASVQMKAQKEPSGAVVSQCLFSIASRLQIIVSEEMQ
jgi:phosphate uptake regulator